METLVTAVLPYSWLQAPFHVPPREAFQVWSSGSCCSGRSAQGRCGGPSPPFMPAPRPSTSTGFQDRRLCSRAGSCWRQVQAYRVLRAAGVPFPGTVRSGRGRHLHGLSPGDASVALWNFRTSFQAISSFSPRHFAPLKCFTRVSSPPELCFRGWRHRQGTAESGGRCRALGAWEGLWVLPAVRGG